MKLLFLAALGLLLFRLPAHAEGGTCPNGYYPINTPGVMGCAPIPGYNQQQQQTPGQTRPNGTWESRWGAIATDESNGIVGSSTGKLKERQAEEAAVADCKAKGGTNCKFAVSYANGCGAMVVGNNQFNVDRAGTEQDAVALAMKTCRTRDTNCHVYFTSCSQAVLSK